MPNILRAHLGLLIFYKSIMPVKKLCKAGLDIITRGRIDFPLSVNLLITDRCNFSCRMCSWGEMAGGSSGGGKELNLADIERFILQIKAYRPLIHIGGGEPFMRRDLLDIIRIIKTNKLKCLIATNGLLMDEDLVDRMMALRVDGLIFSLYGWRGIHDEITGVKGAFERVITNLKSVLSKRTKPTKVLASTLPLPENLGDLKHLVDNLYNLGVDGVKIEQLNFITRKERSRSLDPEKKFNLSCSTLVRDSLFGEDFIDNLIKVYSDIGKSHKGFCLIKPALSPAQLKDWYISLPSRNPKCFFITHSSFINYNGDIIPCQFLARCVLGNIKNSSLKEVWQSPRYKELRKTITSSGLAVCMRCCKN